MIEVYHWGQARSRRVIWVLEELGVPYKVRAVRFPPRLRDPDYLKVNPMGTIPTLVDGEVRLTESLAICEYLARRYGGENLLVSADEPDYPAYLQFLHYGESTLGHSIVPIVRYSTGRSAETYAEVAGHFRETFCERLEPVRQWLADDRAFLAGGRLTLADVSTAYAVNMARVLGMGGQLKPELARYLDELARRPAFQRAYAVA
jgi:glutathione S-transferase